MTKDEAIDREDLIDAEGGENRALRSFLMQYSCDRSITVGAMLAHMNRSGWRGTAPAFALAVRPETHLTKGGAQIWIRHLIGLEAQTSEAVAEPDALRKWAAIKEDEATLWGCGYEAARSWVAMQISAQPAADPAPVPAQTGTIDSDEFRALAMAWSDAATECWPSKTLDGWNALIAHTESYIAARATAERKEGYESQLPRIRHLENERDAARRAARDNSRAILDEYRAVAMETSAAIRELNSVLATTEAPCKKN